MNNAIFYSWAELGWPAPEHRRVMLLRIEPTPRGRGAYLARLYHRAIRMRFPERHYRIGNIDATGGVWIATPRHCPRCGTESVIDVKRP